MQKRKWWKLGDGIEQQQNKRHRDRYQSKWCSKITLWREIDERVARPPVSPDDEENAHPFMWYERQECATDFEFDELFEQLTSRIQRMPPVHILSRQIHCLAVPQIQENDYEMIASILNDVQNALDSARAQFIDVICDASQFDLLAREMLRIAVEREHQHKFLTVEARKRLCRMTCAYLRCSTSWQWSWIMLLILQNPLPHILRDVSWTQYERWTFIGFTLFLGCRNVHESWHKVMRTWNWFFAPTQNKRLLEQESLTWNIEIICSTWVMCYRESCARGLHLAPAPLTGPLTVPLRTALLRYLLENANQPIRIQQIPHAFWLLLYSENNRWYISNFLPDDQNPVMKAKPLHQGVYYLASAEDNVGALFSYPIVFEFLRLACMQALNQNRCRGFCTRNNLFATNVLAQESQRIGKIIVAEFQRLCRMHDARASAQVPSLTVFFFKNLCVCKPAKHGGVVNRACMLQEAWPYLGEHVRSIFRLFVTTSLNPTCTLFNVGCVQMLTKFRLESLEELLGACDVVNNFSNTSRDANSFLQAQASRVIISKDVPYFVDLFRELHLMWSSILYDINIVRLVLQFAL